MSFASRQTIRFSDCDSAGIVFFGNYYHLAHAAFEDLVIHMGFKFDEWFNNSKWGVPLRHSQCTYHRPLRAGEACAVRIYPTKLSESAMVMNYRLEVAGELRAEVELVHVFAELTPEGMRKIKMPSHVRSALETYQRECGTPENFTKG